MVKQIYAKKISKQIVFITELICTTRCVEIQKNNLFYLSNPYCNDQIILPFRLLQPSWLSVFY